MNLRYVTTDSIRTASGVSTDFINDADMEELLVDMESWTEKFFNVRFTPTTVIEQQNGNNSERIILKHNPLLKVRAIKIDDTDIDIDDVRTDKEPGVVWLTTEAETSSFYSRTNERNLVRIKYDYGLLEATTTQTTTSADETEGDSVVVTVASGTGFELNDYIEIEGFDSLREVCKIINVSSNDLTVDNLATSHESGSMVTKLQVPQIAKRLMRITCSLAVIARLVGQSFDEITHYTIGDMEVSLGEPYTQFRETAIQLRNEWKDIRMAFRVRPAIA